MGATLMSAKADDENYFGRRDEKTGAGEAGEDCICECKGVLASYSSLSLT